MDAAKERANRLKRLREAKLAKESAGNTADASSDDEGEREAKKPALKFRNYTPKDDTLKEATLEKPPVPALGHEDAKMAQAKAQHETAFVKASDSTSTAQPAQDDDEPLVNLAPKKPNWDLKRDVAKKLEKLNAMTQQAIYNLIKQKVETEGGKAAGDGNDSDSYESEYETDSEEEGGK